MSTKARKGNRLTDVSSAIFAKNHNKRCKNTLKIYSEMLKNRSDINAFSIPNF